MKKLSEIANGNARLAFLAGIRSVEEGYKLLLKEYGNYDDIALDNIKAAEAREKILKKYIWVMTFHNRVCRKAQKTGAGPLQML